MGVRLRVEYYNGLLDLEPPDAVAQQGAQPCYDYPLKGVVVAYVGEVSGELMGAEIVRFDEAYTEIVQSAAALSLPTSYDVLELGLKDASLLEVLQKCYERYVLQQQR